MKSKDYIINRDDIYVGVVSYVDKDKIKVFPDGIYDLELSIHDDITRKFANRKFMLEPKEQLLYGNGNTIDGFKRSMIFVFIT